MRRVPAVVFLLLLLLPMGLAAQTHNAIPVSEKALYDLLDNAGIRGLIRPVTTAKPYAKSLVAELLGEIEKRKNLLSPPEQAVLADFLEKYVEDPDLPFNRDGDTRIESDAFPTTIGGYLNGTLSADFADLDEGVAGSAVLGGYAQGDAGKHVSWGVDFSFGAFLVDEYDTTASYGPETFEPYTYTKTWDGGLRPFSNMDEFEQMPTDFSFGYAYAGEISASFFKNRLDLRFGRLRHEWGNGEGSIFHDGNARPFFALEGTWSPFKWLSISSLNGGLEYGEDFRNIDDYKIKGTAEEQQNMFTSFQIELFPTDWFYFAFYDAAVYIKRPEYGYLFPLMSPLLSQNNTGDFDNLMMGATLGFSWPGIFRTYFSLFLDEMRPDEPNFFNNPANMYSFQAGIKAPIPGIAWSNLTLQYTKIEPFTYTHYYSTNDPYASEESPKNINYMNNGENLGYGLEPNSDEIMLKLSSQFRRGISWTGGYRMIRHGYAGAGGPDGSTFDAWADPRDGGPTSPNDDPNGAYHPTASKDFLKDGTYEWYHIFSLGGTLDTRIWNEPVQFSLGYSFTWLYYTDYEENNSYERINSGTFKDQFRHVITLSAGVSIY